MKLEAKWHVLIGGLLSYIFDCFDLILLSVALPTIIKDLGLSLVTGGLLATATFLGIGLSVFVLGWYADNYGRKKAMILSLVSFGLFTAATAFANNAETILALRFLAGVGLGGLWNICATYVAETWPASQRAMATGVVLGAFPIGSALAATIAGLVLPRYGWRALFLFGAVSLLAALYVYLFVPETDAWKQQKAAAASEEKKQSVGIGELFGKDLRWRTVIGTIAASFALVGSWGVLTWIPTFITKVRGFDTVFMSQWMLYMSAGMLVGYLVAGYLADMVGRKVVVAAMFICNVIVTPLLVLAASASTLLWLAPAWGFGAAYAGLFGTIFAEMFPVRVRALGTGFCFNIGRAFTALCPVVLGAIGAAYGLQVGIMLCAGAFFLAAVSAVMLPRTGQ